MDCLIDYVGLRGCGTSTPASNHYINDLPGIGLKNFVALTNEEEKTYVELWNMIQKRAANRFSLDVREEMNKHYKLRNVTQAINIGKQIDLLKGPSVNVNNYFGFSIDLLNNQYSKSDLYIPSPLASIHIQELSFLCDGNSFIISIMDKYTGDILFSSLINPIGGGWQNIQINKTFHNNYNQNSWGLFVTVTNYNLNDIYDLNIPSNLSYGDCCAAIVKGVKFDTYYNIVEDSNSRGLTGIFNVTCSWDAVVCQNKNLFLRPWWYLCGIEFLTEQLYSNKINRFTTVDLAKTEKLRVEYQTEYQKNLEQICDGFNLSCDCCIECNDPVQLHETTKFY